MDTGQISKPVAPAPPVTPVRADQLVAAGAVKTELAPESAVQQAGEAPAVQFAPHEGADFRASLESALRDVIDRNLLVDPRSRELVFQSVNKETGEVVRQLPDEAILRLRDYLGKMIDAEERAHNGVRRVERIA
jgi:uncharacterized FlaG/YvyC family protein